MGLVGRNGSGKSTLLTILEGKTEPSVGSVSRPGKVAMLCRIQPAGGTVASALGIADELARLTRLEAGEGSVEDAERADWTLEQRITDAFAQVRLPVGLDRDVGTLSGGERTRLGLAAMLLAEPDVLLTDEPTNNIDAEGRAAIFERLAAWPGGAIVASHDRELLEAVDRIVQLSAVGILSYGGGWSGYARRERAESEARRQLKVITCCGSTCRPPICRPAAPCCASRMSWRSTVSDTCSARSRSR